MSAIAAEKIETLSACLGTYPHTKALKSGDIKSDRVSFSFTEINPVNRAFMPMAREQKFDVCEMAIVTYLQAKAYGKPLMLLPATMMARFQHGELLYNTERGMLRPQDLAGRQDRRTGVFADHWRLDPRHPVEGLRARSCQSELGHVRGRSRRRISRSARSRACPRRQGHRQNADRWRTRCRHLRRRHAERSAAEKRHPRSGGGRQGMVRKTRNRADQPHGCRQGQSREIRRRGAAAKSSACCSQARKPQVCPSLAPSTSFHSVTMRSNRRSN